LAMNFPLQVGKAIQAIGVLFRQDGVNRMNYMRLLKLLYIADREALKETGRPITGGPVVAMERGPVLEEVYDLIRGQHQEMPLWDRYLRKDKYTLQLVSDPDVRKLSKYEIKKLQEIAERHQNDDEWSLSQFTHTFEEWRKNSAGASCRPIAFKDILKAIGLADSAEAIMDDMRHLTQIQRDLGRKT
jgi:uncharacterized phage-associated protein